MRGSPIGVALGIDLILVALHAANAIPVPPLQRPSFFFDLGTEANLPTWWASVQLWTASLLLARAASLRADRIGMWLGGVLLALLSLDETTGLHERLAAATRTGLLPVTGLWRYVLAPILLMAALGVAYVGRRSGHGAWTSGPRLSWPVAWSFLSPSRPAWSCSPTL